MSEWFPVTNDDEIPFDIDIEFNLYEEQARILSNPNLIYKYLTDRIIGQDEACKAVSIFAWNHYFERPQRMLLCGPSGCGKTELFRQLSTLLDPDVHIVSCENITRTGIVGPSVSSFLYDIDPTESENDKIIVFDEADKLLIGQHNGIEGSHGIQAEMLSLLTAESSPHKHIKLHASQAYPDAAKRRLKINGYSYVFCGAFDSLATKLSEANNHIGFGASHESTQPYMKALTIKDIMNFGMMRELASRLQNVVCLNPISQDDFLRFVTTFENNPISAFESKYSLPAGFIRQNLLSEERLTKLAANAFESGLGIRSINAAIQSEIDNWIFNHFDEYNSIKI